MTDAGFFRGQGAIVIRVDDLERMVRFYSDFGLMTNKVGPTYAQFDLGNGAKLDLTRVAAGTPANRVVNAKEQVRLNPIIRVRDAEAAAARAVAAGATLVETWRGHNHVLAYVTDPEGNLIGLGQLPE